MKFLDLDLDVYQGPFDLLFALVLKNEIDILEIPVLEIIVAYAERLATSSEVDWDSLSEFLVLIAGMLQLKVRRLLPDVTEAEEPPSVDEARDLLVERLLTYQRFKRAASYLSELSNKERGHLLRPPSRQYGVRLLAPEVVAGTEAPHLLGTSLKAITQQWRRPEMSHLVGARVAVKRQIGILRRLLRERGRVSFEAEFGQDEPLLQAVTLLAICNLLARGEVEAEQRVPFGDIVIHGRQHTHVNPTTTPAKRDDG